MAPTVRKCKKCFKPMSMGYRVQVSFRWELGLPYTCSARTEFICRECAEKEARKLGLEIPEEVIG